MYFIQICPSDSMFLYETCIQLHNFKKSGIDHLSRVVVYTPPGKKVHPKWKELENLFPNASFFYYTGDPNIQRLITSFNYIPLLRIWCWIQHLREIEYTEPIFYHDSDILFPKGVEWMQPFLKDDIIYQSDTSSYLSSDYLLSKERDVLSHKTESYKELDILQLFATTAGIDKSLLLENKNSTGGAQTLLKGKSLTSSFWEGVLNSCLNILILSRSINKQYFPNEDKGFQTWALGDMGALLWNLWKEGLTTATPKEFDFSWATSPIEQLDKHSIFHNAGACHEPVDYRGEKHYLYNKKGNLQSTGHYSYTHDWSYPHLETPFSHPQQNISNQFCSYYYFQQVEQCRKLYPL